MRLGVLDEFQSSLVDFPLNGFGRLSRDAVE